MSLACPPVLLEAAVTRSTLSLGEGTAEGNCLYLARVCMCVTDRGRVHASLLYPSYLLHLSYDFRLELSKF